MATKKNIVPYADPKAAPSIGTMTPEEWAEYVAARAEELGVDIGKDGNVYARTKDPWSGIEKSTVTPATPQEIAKKVKSVQDTGLPPLVGKNLRNMAAKSDEQFQAGLEHRARQVAQETDTAVMVNGTLVKPDDEDPANECPDCGAKLPPGAKYCIECGAQVDDGDADEGDDAENAKKPDAKSDKELKAEAEGRVDDAGRHHKSNGDYTDKGRSNTGKLLSEMTDDELANMVHTRAGSVGARLSDNVARIGESTVGRKLQENKWSQLEPFRGIE